MAVEPTAEKLCSHTRIISAARSDCPCLKPDVPQSVLDEVTEDIDGCLTLLEPTMTNANARIGLFSLSAELRNRIYELALNVTGGKRSKIIISSPTKIRKLHVPPLLHASRQLRSETSALYFSNKTFSFRIPPEGLEDMCRVVGSWLDGIGAAQASKIGKVEVKFQDAHRDEFGREIGFCKDRHLKKRDLLRVLDVLDRGVEAKSVGVWYRE